MSMRARLAKLEGNSGQRLVIATIPDGSTVEEVAAAQAFTIMVTDLVVGVMKPTREFACRIWVAGDGR